MNVAVVDHQGKAQFLADTLSDCGVHVQPRFEWEGLDAILMDSPALWGTYYPDGGKWQLALAARSRNVKVVGIPHGAGPMYDWDDTVEPWDDLAVELVHGPGQKRLLEFFGYPVPVVEVGWSYCDLKVPRIVGSVDRVLFAPTHPGVTGQLEAPFKAGNVRAFTQFLALPCREKVVRYSGTLEQNGLYRDERVTEWVESDLTIQTAVEDIDRADLVVGDGTFLHLAVARGVPAVSAGEPINLSIESGRSFPRWDEYNDWFRYPFSLDELSLVEAAEQAGLPSRALREWRDTWVGGPLNPVVLRKALL